MHKILFICHGNICRSPMAEYIMKDLVERRDLSHQFLIDSAAATNDAIGMPMDSRAKRELDQRGIKYDHHQARKITKEDYQKFDYLISMDEENFMDVNRVTAGDPDHKEFKLMNFANSFRDIDDPWYTNDFKTAYLDIRKGCQGLLNKLLQLDN